MTVPSPTQTPSPSSSQVETEASENSREKDSLHILPLSIIPLETPSLKQARLLKDASLKSVVELFRDKDAGSARLDPSHLHQVFGWPEDPVHPDLATIEALSGLHSYDVFSLRIELRRLNLPVNDYSDLQLSEDKNRELTKYMADFTRPLIQQVYGNTETQINDVNELIAMFSNPNKEEALNNLKLMAEKLSVQIEDIPSFLHEYGDIFLSLAYFKEQLDAVVPQITDFTTTLYELKLNYQLRQNRTFISTCNDIQKSFGDIVSSITGRFESFDRHSENLWENITAESFRNVKALIAAHHTTIGGVLCGLRVKMSAWDEKFGDDRGGPMERSEFIMSEIKRGIDVITRIEGEARKVAAH